MVRLVAEILLAPALVGCSTLASRRWGAETGGLVSAFPAVVGPVLLISSQEHGAAFAARAAEGTMWGLTALGAFAVSYGWVARRARWWASVAPAWVSAALTATLVGWAAGGLSFPAGLCFAVVSLAVAYAALPTVTRPTAATQTTNDDGLVQRRRGVWVRMTLTAVLVIVLAWMAQLFGPLIGGMLAALPVLASVLVVFTHHHDGAGAVVELLRGMLKGMAGFVGFCGTVAALIVPIGPAAAFVLATAAAIALQVLPLCARAVLVRRAALPRSASSPQI
jgi:hypothetical protein